MTSTRGAIGPRRRERWRGLAGRPTGLFPDESSAIRRLARRLVVVWLMAMVAVAALIAAAPPPEQPASAPAPALISDLRLEPMLERHQAMTQRMRAGLPHGHMTEVMVTDVMFRDWSPWMVAEQEAYMAQMDRMVGRR